MSESDSSRAADISEARREREIITKKVPPELGLDALDAMRREAKDRSFIATWVVIAYFIGLLAILALLVTRAIVSGLWDSAVSEAFEIFKIGVLPVVTLVIGHYFGRRERP